MFNNVIFTGYFVFSLHSQFELDSKCILLFNMSCT